MIEESSEVKELELAPVEEEIVLYSAEIGAHKDYCECTSYHGINNLNKTDKVIPSYY